MGATEPIYTAEEMRAAVLEAVEGADAIVMEEIAAAGLGRTLWQAFAVLVPLCAVTLAGATRIFRRAVA